jgi:hypothetical protein
VRVVAQMACNNTVMICNTSAPFFFDLMLFAIDGIYIVEDVAFSALL